MEYLAALQLLLELVQSVLQGGPVLPSEEETAYKAIRAIHDAMARRKYGSQ